ncbi:CUE domain-containing protein 1 [Contarinia nasturtii]|uniref:CUE domain-containing protein 1 n=1 Tax=Contarinia nasturtii TaxID=265458 RepID=UPI0012D3CC85|nr:CUE domain-containing protein 1 [Contarinia nasturtii]
MASTLQLEFAQAMSDFKTMFPDMERDVIEAVLRANQGGVDATIDQLLAMSTDNQNEKLRNELEQSASNSPVQSSQNHSAIVEKDLIVPISSTIVSTSSVNRVTGASPKVKCPSTLATSSASARPNSTNSNRWEPPLLGPLPPSFLRLTSNENRSDFEIPDEQFAIMLQNEEFMNELRWNQEFMLALEKEQQEKGSKVDDLVFTERLKHMGKRSRKKFMQLAKVFTWQRNKKPGAVRHPDSLLLQEEHSDDDEQPRRIQKK